MNDMEDQIKRIKQMVLKASQSLEYDKRSPSVIKMPSLLKQLLQEYRKTVYDHWMKEKEALRVKGQGLDT